MGRHPYGYGIFWNGERRLTASRFAWFAAFGEPGDQQVLHRCDNPPCCNPAHLFLGTHADNMADRLAKGRYDSNAHRWRGEANPNAKLTDDQVREIRERYELHSHGPNGGAALAREFGVSTTTVSYIVWNHVRPDAGGPIQPPRQKDQCPRGHAYTPENTRIRSGDGARVCRTCRREDARRRRARP